VLLVWTSAVVQVHVMEVECWNATASGPVSVSKLGSSFSSRRASIDVDGMFFAPPDVVVPFTSYVDVGLRTNVKRRQADESVCWAVGCPTHAPRTPVTTALIASPCCLMDSSRICIHEIVRTAGSQMYLWRR
jgi:hypothetical protein